MTATWDEATAQEVARLVGRAAEGDRWAWDRLVDQYARLIRATSNPELRGSDAAEGSRLQLLEHIHVQ